MSAHEPCVLVVDDDAPLRDLVTGWLASNGFQPATAEDPAAAERYLTSSGPLDVILTDVRMPGGSGIDLAARARDLRPDVPVIVMTGFGDLETAIGAVRSGAYDFVSKPFDLRDLTIRLRRAAEQRALKQQVIHLREDRAGGVPFDSIVGRSPGMEQVFVMIERLAPSDASVLILGETGTGKELVARALHGRSPRARGPFVALNCAATTETLLEAELFGHTKGAFTDARSARAGLFVQASGGSLFLDEVAEMPLALQAKILRALQERTVRPVGADREVPFDARVLSATHRDLEQRIVDGSFREDLFYRLNVLEIRLPPLRSRGSDVLVLAQDFVARFAERTGSPVLSIDPGCARCLLEYSWPGNVRELANVIERAVTLARGDTITIGDLPEKLTRADRAHVIAAGDDPSELVKLEEIERRYILKVLAACGGQRTRAAEVLGIDRKTLYSKLKQYGVSQPPPP